MQATTPPARVQRIATIGAISAGLLPALLVVTTSLIPGFFLHVPTIFSEIVFLVGFACCTRLIEAHAENGKAVPVALSVLGAVAFAGLAYVTLSYCPGGR